MSSPSASLTTKAPVAATRRDDRALLLRAWRLFFRQYRWKIGLTLLAMLGTAATTWALVYMIETVVTKVIDAKDAGFLPTLAIIIVVIFVVRASANFLERALLEDVSARALRAIREAAAFHAISLDMAFFGRTPPGELISRLTSDVARLQAAVREMVIAVIRELPTIAGLVVYLVWTDWVWTVSSLIILPVLVLPITIANRHVRRLAGKVAEQEARVVTAFDETFHGMQAVKTNTAEPAVRARLAGRLGLQLKSALKEIWIRAAIPGLADIVAMFAVLVIVIGGGYQVISGEKTSGELVGFLSAIMLIYQPLKKLITFNAQLQNILVSLKRVFEVLDVRHMITDRADAATAARGAGHVRFEDVSFGYDAGLPVLQGVSFDVKPGEKVALVGPSGAGKTTVFALLTRLFDAGTGRVLLDDRAVTDVTQVSLRRQIALVTQGVTLFDDSVRANLLIGNPDASEDQLIAALKAAQAYDFVQALPEGLDSQVGPRGDRLSGGQKQRLVIARAIVRDAPVLLLDEATSALDTQTEKAVQAALDELSENRTTLVIAHRLSTVRNADRVLVFDGGRIVEQGTHDVLMASSGRYAAMVKAQLSA